METESSTERKSILSNKIARPLLEEFFLSHPAIRNTRRKTLLLLTIELGIMVIYLVLQMVMFFFTRTDPHKMYNSTLIELFLTIISIVHIIAFIIVVIEYFPTAILIFAYLTLIQLIGGFLLLVLAIMTTVVSLTIIHAVGFGILLDLAYILIAISMIGLSVYIAVYSLTLLKLNKT
ncbi:unnamed protein product [Adineta steineri]|uniref:Uncharacterized protein n=1 Tax=Adineta steineri TaxID=433720 RepID=A0A819HK62_9BILA|nr:unnamed protein product [Adineta steineri]CAF3905092.1 unnamed protein product [Adineta steineri]